MKAASRAKARPRRGRPAKQEGRDSRGSLVPAAIQVFSRRGFANANLKEITSEAGVSIGLVRHYFGSKDALIEAANTQVISELRQVFSTILSDIDTDDGEELLKQIHERQLRILLPRVHLLFYLKHLIIERPAEAQNVIRDYFQMLQDHFVRLEAAGALRSDANKIWLTFLLMFVQLGPVFLSEQIQSIIGRSPFTAEVARERGQAAGHLFDGVLRPR